MIFKRDLLESIDALTEQLVLQGEEILNLKDRVGRLEPKKNKIGRPRKNSK